MKTYTKDKNFVFKHSNFSASVLKNITAKNLFKSCDTLVVGFSGGADSTALLHLLRFLPGFNLNIIAAHLNHSLRGSESDDDEIFCHDFSTKLGVRFESEKIDLKKYATENRMNLEDAGREARITFFDRLKVEYGASAVVLAHHADDQAETVLMRLIRGSGTNGLSGMRYRNARGYVRPFLSITRSEIIDYLNENGLSWREDSSNRDCIYLRNRIRHNLLPTLEEYNRAIRKRLAANAELLGDDDDFLQSAAISAADSLLQNSGDKIFCHITGLLKLHKSLIRRVLRIMFERCSGSAASLSQQHIGSVLALLLDAAPNSSLNLPNGVVALREYDKIYFCLANEPAEELREIEIVGDGVWSLWSDLQIFVSFAESIPELLAESLAESGEYEIVVDLDAAPFPWKVRTFKAGDRIQPLGMNGTKKVKDIYIDAKIPLSERSVIPLVFSGDLLIWIAAVRLSQVAAVNNDTKKIAVVKLSRGKISNDID